MMLRLQATASSISGQAARSLSFRRSALSSTGIASTKKQKNGAGLFQNIPKRNFAAFSKISPSFVHAPKLGGRPSNGVLSSGRVEALKKAYATATGQIERFRNVAIIAHVDHGKTSLVDTLLRQGGATKEGNESMDSNALERERGITILAKTTAISWKDWTFNIVDTPGHGDFGGEVERVMNMVDGVVLVVDATEGPMPQTKFVLSKALRAGLKPIVVLNKMDRDTQRAAEVETEVFDLFCQLEANEQQMNYPTLYASAREGWAVRKVGDEKSDMTPIFETVLQYVPAPRVEETGKFKMLINLLEQDDYLGKLITGRIFGGSVKVGQALHVLNQGGQKVEEGKVLKILARRGLGKIVLEEGVAGDIVALAGFPKASVTDTISDPSSNDVIKAPPIEPPVISMMFMVNDSPLAGKEGLKLTSNLIKDRLFKEGQGNVAIRVEQTDQKDTFKVSGRGEMQLGVLIETMRREGFELAVSPPAVIYRNGPDGQRLEPIEEVTLDIEEEYIGPMIERLTLRKGELKDMKQSSGRARLIFHIPVRGLLGFRNEFLTETRGTGVLNSAFHSYDKYKGGVNSSRKGSIICMEEGVTTYYALDSLQTRGTLFIGAQTPVYNGMIIGESAKYEDVECNPCKQKQLSNVRSVMKEEAIRLATPKVFTLEEAMSYMEEDELLEVTPKSIRMRKKELDPNKRRRLSRARNQLRKDN